MKQKKYKDCPSCGVKNSMKLKSGLSQKVKPKECPPLTITHLEGYRCDACHDIILTFNSEKKWAKQIAEHKARYLGKHITADKLIDVPTLAKEHDVSRQYIHQLIDTGKVDYVNIGTSRLPVKESVEKYLQKNP